MTKRMESKYKIDRRMGENIWGRPKSPVNRREYGPGQHGQRRKSKLSDYGVQLKAKQKLRGYYGNISEKQFRGIYTEAIRMKGDSGAHMIGLLERRLLAMAIEQVEELRLESCARTIAVEISEKGIVGVFEDEGCVEPRRQPLCQRGFACADRTFHREVAELQGAPMISSRRDAFDD